MIRRIFAICAAACVLTLAPLHLIAHRDQVQAAQTKECTVYVTKTGEKYHRSDCFYLRYSSRPLTRSKAIASGYTPCKRCGGSSCDR